MQPSSHDGCPAPVGCLCAAAKLPVQVEQQHARRRQLVAKLARATAEERRLAAQLEAARRLCASVLELRDPRQLDQDP